MRSRRSTRGNYRNHSATLPDGKEESAEFGLRQQAILCFETGLTRSRAGAMNANLLRE